MAKNPNQNQANTRCFDPSLIEDEELLDDLDIDTPENKTVHARLEALLEAKRLKHDLHDEFADDFGLDSYIDVDRLH